MELSIHEELKNLRISKGLTLKEVAEYVDKSISYISKIENGKQRIDTDFLATLSQLYNTSLIELLSTESVENKSTDRLENEDLSNCFAKVMENYISAKEEEFKGHAIGEIIREKIPSILYEVGNLDKHEYKITGSIGQGQWAEVPWISIFQKSITTSATKGYYIVFLFSATMEEFYLSLNQGWTYYKEKYGTKKGRKKISKVSSYLQKELNLIPKEFSCNEIKLHGRGDLSIGYEAGHICGKRYSLNNLTSTQLLTDLQKILIIYKELISLIGNRNINQFNDYILLENDGKFIEKPDSISFEEQVEKEIKYLPANALRSLFDEEFEEYQNLDEEEKPEKRPDPIIDRQGKKIWPRNSKIAATVLKNAGFTCANNNEHKSFISKATGQPYMEAHHLIPMKLQKDMKYNLDKKANIVCLCPLCHKLIHHGEDSEREEILNKLFFENRPHLEKIKLEITYSALKEAYGIKIEDQ